MRNVFYIMRHAQSDHNVGSWISGDAATDSKSRLTETGKEQARRLGIEAASLGITRIYRSPFERVRATCDILVGQRPVPVSVDDRLRQLDCGFFNGKTWKEREAFFKDHYEKLHRPSPGGESLMDAQRRMVEAVGDIDRWNEGEAILIVSHGNPLRMLQIAALCLPAEAALTDMRALQWKSDVSPDPFIGRLLTDARFDPAAALYGVRTAA